MTVILLFLVIHISFPLKKKDSPPGSDILNMRIRRICCLTNLGTTPLVSSEVVMERERRPFSLGNIILLKEKGGMRESVPMQVDRESRGPQGERGLEFSRRKKG